MSESSGSMKLPVGGSALRQINGAMAVPTDQKPLLGRRVLLVEDEFLVALDAEEILRELGCDEVDTAARVEAALEAVRGRRPDFAVLDVNLDGDTSYGVADALTGLDTPFVLATGYDLEMAVLKRFGHPPVLRKPYDGQTMASAVVEALSRDSKRTIGG